MSDYLVMCKNVDLVLGVDIVSIDRFKRLIDRYGKSLTKQIFTPYEIKTFGHSMQSLAARYAAKEATSKALKVGLLHMSSGGVSATDIEVYSQNNGAPALKLYGVAWQLAQNLQIQTLQISLSHERHYAIAMVTGFTFGDR